MTESQILIEIEKNAQKERRIREKLRTADISTNEWNKLRKEQYNITKSNIELTIQLKRINGEFDNTDQELITELLYEHLTTLTMLHHVATGVTKSIVNTQNEIIEQLQTHTTQQNNIIEALHQNKPHNTPPCQEKTEQNT